MLVYCWKVISCLRYSNTLESPNGQQCSLLGHPAYPMPTFIMKGYQAAAQANDEQTFSITMSTERQTVQWGFGDILSQWAFVDFRKQQKFSLQPVAVLIQGSCSSYELFLEEAAERRGFSTWPLLRWMSSWHNCHYFWHSTNIYSICGQYCFVLCGLISAAQRNEAEPDSNEE